MARRYLCRLRPGVNTAIDKIRLALGDEADNPRFIQTLPGRGYRFICPVLTGDGQLAEAEHPATAATPVVETGPIDQRLSARPRFLVTILVSCFALALAVIVYLGVAANARWSVSWFGIRDVGRAPFSKP